MAKKKKEISNPSIDGYKVQVLAITDTGSIITAGCNDFDYGVVFQHGIQYESTPLPIDIASNFAPNNISVGKKIRIYVNSITEIDGRKVAISTIETAGRNEEDEIVFMNMVVGQNYRLTVFDYNDEYVTLRVPGTSLRGYIDAKAIPNPEVGDEYDLILSKKGNSVFHFMTFELELNDTDNDADSDSQVDVDELYINMFRQELSVISDEDENLIKKLLSDYPKLDRYNKYLADVSHIYCRCTSQTQMIYDEFCCKYPNYLSDHNFFITCDLKELSFTIFDSEYVVFKLYGDGECLWLREFYYDRKDIRAKVLCDENKNRKLIVEGHKLHFIDHFNAIPHSFDWRDTMVYTSRMTDFYYVTLKKINSDYLAKQTAETREFVILRDLIKYEKELEEHKGGKVIRINENYPINRTPTLEYERGVAYSFNLDKTDYDALCGIMDADEELFVSLYDPSKKDKPVRNGKMFYDEDKLLARIEFRKDTPKELLRKGLLKKRNSTEHLDIQIDAISTLFRRKEQKFYQSIIPSEFVEPDITPYQDITFFDKNIQNAAEGNNQPIAVKKALGNKQVLLIQGPPGTGKTTVIIEIIRQLAKEGKNVLVCSQTHAAVRNIIDKLTPLQDELSFISIENDGEEEAWGAGFDMEEYKQFLSNNRELIQLLRDNEPVEKDDIRKQFTYNTKNGEKYLSYHYYIIDYYRASKALYKNADAIIAHLLEESDISGRLLDSYRYQIQDVILGTCIGIGMNRNVRGMHFDTVIIDEAAKANLAESLVPMRLGERYILVGDDKQLPPYTDRQMISDFVIDNNSKGDAVPQLSNGDVIETISKSLFELYHDNMDDDSENVVMLNYQYRMHPEIGNFISDVFYDGKVNMGENTMLQFISLPSPYNEPIHFVDTEKRPDHWERKSGQSFINMCEANLICNELLPLIDQAGLPKETSLAIITPYSGQRELLRNHLKGSVYYGSVYTIDAIQGMEFDIVIFSFVRSFSTKYDKTVGFLDDMRRLNVSLSRAKKKLILVGNKPTLTRPEAHRDSDTSVINPVNVFEKLSQSYIQYVNPSKARMFHDKYNLGDEVLCLINKLDEGYIYFCVKDNPALAFRRPLKAYEIQQLMDATEVIMEITHYSDSLQPYFRVASYLKNEEFVKLLDFNELTSNFRLGTMIDCKVDSVGQSITGNHKGLYCIIPKGAFTEEFAQGLNIGDTIQARVYYVDQEKVLLYPVLPSYETHIRNRELTRFFFSVEEKYTPLEVTITFDSGEKADFSISNKFLWDALREDDMYCEFMTDRYDDNILIYKYKQQSFFKEHHPAGDLVKVHISFISPKKCIAWCEGVVAIINNYKGKNLEVGEDYYVMVTYNEKDQLEFKMV